MAPARRRRVRERAFRERIDRVDLALVADIGDQGEGDARRDDVAVAVVALVVTAGEDAVEVRGARARWE